MWMVCGLIMSCFFFFQAEDGIRDYKVTGVQTCALPIYLPAALRRDLTLSIDDATRRIPPAPATSISTCRRGRMATAVPRRSEERRVGKDWDGREAPKRRTRWKSRQGAVNTCD